MTASPSALPLTIITHEFFPTKGGIATFVEEIARACHELGQNVEVWAPRNATPFECTFPFRVHRVPLRGTHDFTCRVRMMREIVRHRRRLRTGVLHLAEPGPLLAMMYLQFFKAVQPRRLLLTFHGSEIQRFAASPPARLLIGQLIRAAHRVSTLSRYTRQLLCDQFPMAAEKVVVTSGAPRSQFDAPYPSRAKQDGKLVVLGVGRLHPRKGQHHVMDALDRLPPALADRVEYWIVGRGARGDYEAHLRQRASRCRVPVCFLGNVENEELEAVYQRSDIFALTSVNHGSSVEGFGLAYLDASNFGLPIVANMVGGVAEVVRDGETGILVPPGDASALAAAFEKLIRAPALRERMGRAGRAWAREHSWRDSARILIDGVASFSPASLQPA